MSEIEVLLNELKNIKSTGRKTVENNANTWKCIANKDWEGAGFANEEEAKQFILDNPYGNLA